MASQSFDVVGIGNAIVDVIAQADEAFLARQGLAKGSMRLIDAAEAEALYGAMGPGIEWAGGSAANTIAGLASLGGVRQLRRLAEGRLGGRRIEQIALEISHLRGADELGRHVVGPEPARGAEERAHGALRVRRHQDEAARRG